MQSYYLNYETLLVFTPISFYLSLDLIQDYTLHVKDIFLV